MAIRTRFLLIFLLTSLAPLVILTAFIFNASQTVIREKTKENIETIALFKESRIGLIINDYVRQAALVANRPPLLNMVDQFNKTKSPELSKQIHDYLIVIKETLQEPKSISITDTKNIIIASTDNSQIGKPGNISNSVARIEVKENEPISAVIEQPLILNSLPIGYLELVDQGSQLATITKDLTGLGKTGDILLVKNDSGDLSISASRFQKDDPHQKTLKSQLSDASVTNALKNKKNTSGVAGKDSAYFFSIYYLKDYDASLIVKIDNNEAFAIVDSLRDNILIFSLIFALVVIMAILFFVHSLTAPIANLAAVAKKTASGDLKDRALVLSKDEIGSLATTFNHMLDELQKLKTSLEDQVNQRTKQLEVANKELEAFSYSVSHDLRAPLRAIDGFSKILTEDYSNKLDADGKRVIDVIVSNTQQMGRLIDDLLAFSRLGRQEVKKQEVNMKSLVNEVIAEQLGANPDRKIKINIKDLPNTFADAALLRQVWTNLFSNAIKFTRKTSKAVIEVGCAANKKTTTYYVKDNGAGFNMAYIDKLFGVFQRLHDQKDFEGTGVGLALVKRIIERQGGRVWAEAEVDKGATMYFELPNLRHPKKEKL